MVELKRPLIVDTTLRDGEQTPGVSFTPEQKLELAGEFADFGVDLIELYPAVSDAEAQVTKELSNEWFGDRIRALCRCTREDIEAAASSDAPRILLFTSFSDILLKGKLGITREENLARSVEMTDYARSHGLVVDFAGEDASRADFAHVEEIALSLKGKIEHFMPADTVGSFMNGEVRERVERLTKLGLKVELHEHNDFGLATANTIAGLEAGAAAFSATFCGLGERAGNAAIEEVLALLEFRLGRKLDLRLEKLKTLSEKVARHAGIQLNPSKPVIGSNAFAHVAGLHIDGMMKDPRTYENFAPESVGQARRFYFGKLSGKGGVGRFLQSTGVLLSQEELALFTAMLKEESERRSGTLSEPELFVLYSQFKRRAGGHGSTG